MEFFIQSIGVLGIIASIISFQCKRHKMILVFRTLNEFLFAVHYILLGAYTGAAMNLVGCVRNTIFSKLVEHKKDTKIPIIIFSILFTIFGIFTWQGLKSILIIVAKVLSTLAYGNKNTTVTRCIILITSSSWLIYNILVHSIAGAACEVFTLTSLIAGIIRFDIVPYFKKRA